MHRGPDGAKTLCNACGMRLQKNKLQLWRTDTGLSAIKKEGAVPANKPLPCYTRKNRCRKRPARMGRRSSSKGTRNVEDQQNGLFFFDDFIDDYEDPFKRLLKLDGPSDVSMPTSFSPVSVMDSESLWSDAIDDGCPYTERFSDRSTTDIHVEELLASSTETLY